MIHKIITLLKVLLPLLIQIISGLVERIVSIRRNKRRKG